MTAAALATPLDLTAHAEVRICKAAELTYDIVGGWRVVGQFIAEVDEGEGYGKEHQPRYVERLHFILGRSEADALADMKRKLDEADKSAYRAVIEKQNALKQLADLQSRVSTGQAAQEALAQVQRTVQKMERDIGHIRKEIGEERMRAIIERAAEEEVPF